MRRDAAAKYAGVALRTLVNWFDLGLPAYRIGGVILIDRHELDSFIFSHPCGVEIASRK